MAVKRQTILNNLKTRLQTITVANGYYSNLGSNIKLFSSLPLQEDELPACVIFDKVNQIDGEGINGSSNVWNHILNVTLQIVCGGNTIDTTARQIIADVYKALSTDLTLSSTCIDINAVSDTLEIEHDSKLVAGATIEILIKYRTNKFLES